jgi:hypothetical protein
MPEQLITTAGVFTIGLLIALLVGHYLFEGFLR